MLCTQHFGAQTEAITYLARDIVRLLEEDF